MRKRTRRCKQAADPLRSCSGDEKWRDWRNMPAELVSEIAGWLLRSDGDGAEYLRLRAACKEWRKCTANADAVCGRNQLDSRFRPRRWTMLSNNTAGARRRFLDVGTGACFNVDLPKLSTHYLQATTEGLLLLRHKRSHAARLLNPLTKALIDLPPITKELGAVHDAWTKDRVYNQRHTVYAGISDETSQATVVLMMRGISKCLIVACAKPGDERWEVMGTDGWSSIPLEYTGFSYMSTLTQRGRVYLVTFEGNILQVAIHPTPRLVPVVLERVLMPYDVSSYLVPADDDHGGMLMVRYYRRVVDRQNTDVIKLTNPSSPSRYLWQLIELFKVDLAGKRLVKVELEHISPRRAVFVGEAACLSLSTKMFPSLAGNAVYIGVNGSEPSSVGVRYLGSKKFDPPFDFMREDVTTNETRIWRTEVEPSAPCPPLYAPRVSRLLYWVQGWHQGLVVVGIPSINLNN